MRRVGISAVSIASAVAIGLTTACSEPYRNGSGEITRTTTLTAEDLRPGDCFDDSPEPATRVIEILALPCAEPHDNQVFTIETHEAGATEPYPSAVELGDYARTTCAVAFEQETDVAVSLDFSSIVPSESSWKRGDRLIVCLLWDRDFHKLRDSMLSGRG